MNLRPALFRTALPVVALFALAACEKVPPRTTATAAAPAAMPSAPAAGSTAPSAAAPDADGLVPNVDYVAIANGAPFEATPGTIEVVEVFGYTCPHCAHFEPMLAAWKARQPADVRLVPVPAPFGGWWMPFAKAYYAAQELGIAEKTHGAVFNALHVEKSLPAPPAIATTGQVAQFYGRHGVDAAEFARRMDSAPVQQKLRRAEAFIARSGVDGTPSLVVDGRYRVLGRSPEDALRIVDALVTRERAQ